MRSRHKLRLAHWHCPLTKWRIRKGIGPCLREFVYNSSILHSSISPLLLLVPSIRSNWRPSCVSWLDILPAMDPVGHLIARPPSSLSPPLPPSFPIWSSLGPNAWAKHWWPKQTPIVFNLLWCISFRITDWSFSIHSTFVLSYAAEREPGMSMPS